MKTQELNILIGKYLDETISLEERARLALLLENEADLEKFRELLLEQYESGELELQPDKNIGLAIRNNVKASLQLNGDQLMPGEAKMPTRLSWVSGARKWWAAAAVLLLLVPLVYINFRQEQQEPIPATISHKDIPAGQEGAVLTLADGSQVVLDTAREGLVAKQNGADILLSEGAMTYRKKETNNYEVVYNTMTTPKGRQFQFYLPDGTKVWLNAASSIRYPTQFNGRKREVEISGEAFFEVKKNVQQPFAVRVGEEAAIEVLGTSFNVNAYSNAYDIRATLLTGMVSVKNISKNIRGTSGREVLLNPGEQAVVVPAVKLDDSQADGANQAVSVNRSPDLEKAIAWKKGLFNFEGSTLVEVMRELERWYDIEVVYEGAPPAMKFVGKIGKDLSLKDLLEGLDKTKIKFRIEDRKLIVTK